MKMTRWKRFSPSERLEMFTKQMYMVNKDKDTTHQYRLENKDASNNLE